MQLFKINLQKNVKSINITCMDYQFTDTGVDKKILLKQGSINPFLLENNTKQINAVCNFFENNKPLLFINGFMGTGKTSILEHCLSILNPECIILRYQCFETTILDDILLNFFQEFKELVSIGKIEAPKTKSENFIQKINSYFESINKPILVILNSYEEILKINKTEISDFIKHLCKIPNVKIAIISKTQISSEFEIPSEKVTILALEKSLFEKYLRSENFKQIGPFTDELYKHTRGYFFYTNLSMKIMKIKNLSIIDFLDAYSKSFLSFNDFILREALSLVDPVSGHLLRFLTIMRHPVSIKLLQTLQLYDEERINYFLQNSIFAKFKDSLYLESYYKEISENSIPDNVKIKIHQGCVDLYNTQLPLKPFERDLLLSRQTMRNEIEYHSMFIPQKPILTIPDISQEANYTQYSEQAQDTQEISQTIDAAEDKDEKIKKMSFIFDEDELGVLDTIADSIKNYISFSDKRKQEEKEDSKLTLVELVNKAKQEEAAFNYRHATALYQKALLQKNDEEYYTYLPDIYTNIAYDYQQLSNWYDAQKYYEMAKEFYRSAGDTENYNKMKYNIANVYYMTFKKDKAKALLSEIEKDNVSGELKIKTYNMLASLSNDVASSEKYYEKAVEFAEDNVNKLVLAELYYKYANVLEELDDEDSAIEYYKKCINSETESEYMSGALSNIAVMYDEMGERELAVKYYKQSQKLDKTIGNLNGIYTTSMKLGEIYSAKEPDIAVKYYNKALTIAKQLNETFYIISASTALGDFYFNRRNDKMAYDNYKIAYNLVKDTNNKENTDKIENRIKDIKARIGEERFKEIAG